MPRCLSSAWKEGSGWLHKQSRVQLIYDYQQYSDYRQGQRVQTRSHVPNDFDRIEYHKLLGLFVLLCTFKQIMTLMKIHI